MSEGKKLDLSAIIKKDDKIEKKESLEEVTKKEEELISAEDENISNSKKIEENEEKKSHKISISALKEKQKISFENQAKAEKEKEEIASKKEIEKKKEALKNEKEKNIIGSAGEIFSNYKSDFDKEIEQINVKSKENQETENKGISEEKTKIEEKILKSEKNQEKEENKSEEKIIEKETPTIKNTQEKKVKIDNSWEKVAKKEDEKEKIITATETKKEKKSFKGLFIGFGVLVSFTIIGIFGFLFLNQEKTPVIPEIVWEKITIQNFEVEKSIKDGEENFRYKQVVYNSKDELMKILENEIIKQQEEKEKMITQKIKKLVIEKFKD